MQSAILKAKHRLPWTDTPSQDGKSYLTNGTKLAKEALTNSSYSDHFRFIAANNELGDRDRVSSYTEFFFLNGEKGGPMATYLVTASKRKNFRLQLNTTVTRVLRKGDFVTGVQVEASATGGLTGAVKLTPNTGRVILSAGVFGTFKILLRSGIGPIDQLEVLSDHSMEYGKLPKRSEWLNLPVGRNLDDGCNVNSLAASVPNLGYYPWIELWNSTVDNPDIRQYLDSRSGPLAQLQPSIGPVSWDTVLGDDGNKRIIQWDANSGKDDRLPGDCMMVSLRSHIYLDLLTVPIIDGFIGFTSNLNLGHTSRGRLSLNTDSKLTVNISKTPYFNDPGDHDFKAVVTSATSMLRILQGIPGATIVLPPAGLGLEDYLRATPPVSNNHWVGSAKMGESCKNKEAVVNSRTIVCGTKNLHVVDASILNGIPTANPQGTFIVMAERAAEIILNLH